jgi:hypothetical protein
VSGSLWKIGDEHGALVVKWNSMGRSLVVVIVILWLAVGQRLGLIVAEDAVRSWLAAPKGSAFGRRALTGSAQRHRHGSRFGKGLIGTVIVGSGQASIPTLALEQRGQGLVRQAAAEQCASQQS